MSTGTTQCPEALHNVHRHYTMSTGTTQCPQALHNVHRHYAMSTGTTQCPQALQAHVHRHYTMSTGTTQCPQALQAYGQMSSELLCMLHNIAQPIKGAKGLMSCECTTTSRHSKKSLMRATQCGPCTMCPPLLTFHFGRS